MKHLVFWRSIDACLPGDKVYKEQERFHFLDSYMVEKRNGDKVRWKAVDD